MKPFTTLTAKVAPLDRANVDTDAIVPKQFIKSITRSGLGPHLFDEWRYLDRGELGQDCATRPRNPGFVLNDPRYAGAAILLARENFGCGSSREHAAWALADAGFRVVIAPSFADIFHGNCFKNGMLPIVLPAALVDRLFVDATEPDALVLAIDLAAQSVTAPDGTHWRFEIDAFRKERLLQGLDDVALTLAHADEIRAYEAGRRELEPWLFETA